jgi:hypothetical protein
MGRSSGLGRLGGEGGGSLALGSCGPKIRFHTGLPSSTTGRRRASDIIESQHLRTVAMPERMQTSRSELDRLLDTEDASVRLEILVLAAVVVGNRLKIELGVIPR